MRSEVKSIFLLAVGLILFAGILRSGAITATPATPKEMDQDLDADFQRSAAIINGLSQLTTPAMPYKIEKVERHAVARRRKEKRAKAWVVKQLPTPVPAWKGRHIGPLDKETVFGSYQITVDETSPTSFDVTVISSAYAEEIVVKDRRTDKVLLRQSEDDQKFFKVSVTGHPLDNSIMLSIAVLDPNDNNSLHYAAVPLLGSTDLSVTR